MVALLGIPALLGSAAAEVQETATATATLAVVEAVADDNGRPHDEDALLACYPVWWAVCIS